MTREEKDKLVEEVLSDFDFGTVEMVMKMLDWGWAGCGNGVAPPRTDELRDEAKQMLYEVLQDDNAFTHIYRGGLNASWDGKTLQLDFILTTSDCQRTAL